jgi:hypothetical protein
MLTWLRENVVSLLSLQVSYSKVEVEVEVEENEAKRETITVTEIHQEAKRCKEENHWIKPPLGGWG